MQALQLTGPSLDTLRSTVLDDPQPGHGEVLIGMRAASLNFIDVAVATGAYPGPTFPLVPIADGAGEVLALGDGVTSLAPGARVAIHPKALWASGRGDARNAAAMRGVTLPGSLRELAVVSADTLVPIPDHLSWAEAATLPIAATTAWNALVAAEIGPGHTVALLGTGGVSIFALQLAKARGARVVITSSSDEKLERAKAFGADHLVNYRAKPAWDEAVVAATDGRGADLVLETGGSATFARSLAAVRHGGTVFSIGFLTGSRVELDLFSIIGKAIRVQGNNTGSAADLADAVAAIAAHRISPVVDTTYEIGAVGEAYARLAAGGSHLGKVAIALAWS